LRCHRVATLAFVFRAALSKDFDAILRLYEQLQPADVVLDRGAARAAFDRILGSPGLTLFILEEDGRAIATTYLNVIPNITRSASPYAVIENVVVEEPLRGQGFGKRIMTGTLQEAWDAGCYKVMLFTGSKRESTHAFYRACGFVAGDKTGYVARPPSDHSAGTSGQ
jgi:GNAT superfamily N-acetyltransferase